MKKILMILMMCSVVLLPSRVNAQSDSFYEDEAISNVYIAKLNKNSKEYEQIKVHKRKRGNKIAYSTEVFENFNANKQLLGEWGAPYLKVNMDKDIYNRIEYIAYYGYTYGDHTDLKWYAITQYLIWKTISPDTELYFTDSPNGNKINMFEEEILELTNLVDYNMKSPSFSKKTYEIKNNEDYIVEDLNNIISKYKISNNEIDAKILENKIIVNTSVPGEYKIILERKYDFFNGNDERPYIYIDENGSDMFVPGVIEEDYTYVKFKLLPSKITIKNIDYNTRNDDNPTILFGSKFQLLDNKYNVIEEKEVKEDSLVFNNLGYGNYYLKQTSIDEKYKLNTELYPISLTESNVDIIIYNEIILPNIKIITIDEDSKLPIIIEDDNIYKIIDVSTSEYLKDENNNDIEFHNNTIYKLPYGKYKLKQTKASNDYYINRKYYLFEISNNDDLEIQIENTKKLSQIEIIKTIEYYLNDNFVEKKIDNNLEIPIYALNDIYSKDGLKFYSKDEQVSVAKLDNDKVISEKILFGNYYFKNPIDNKIININLTSTTTKKVNILEKVYNYDEKLTETDKEESNEQLNDNNLEEPDENIENSKDNEIEDENIENNEDIEIKEENTENNEEIVKEKDPIGDEQLIIEIPNTYSKKINRNIDFGTITLLISLCLLGKGKKDEKLKA